MSFPSTTFHITERIELTVYLKKFDSVVPSTFSVDFREIVAEEGPLWLSFDYWVSTPDAITSGIGNISVDVSWVDPTSNIQSEFGTTLSLADGVTKNANNKVFAVQMLDGNSDFKFNVVLGGLPGDALVSYRIMLQKEQAYIDWP